MQFELLQRAVGCENWDSTT